MGHKASSTASEKQFAFVFVNQEDDNENSASRREVRAHAMRESLRQRRLGSTTTFPKSSTTLPYRTGRFRLAAAQTKTKTKASKVSVTARSITQMSAPKEMEESSGKETESVSTSLTTLKPSGQVDPFHSLPIKLGLRQQALLYYYDKSFVQNSVAFNNDRRIISLAAVDSAWLNATFSLVAMSYDFQRGVARNQSSDCLFYRGQALRLVNEQLSASSTDIKDSTIGAVATLCNFDIGSGNLASATAHMAGLQQLVAMRGGIQKLALVPGFLPKLVSWSDIAYAAVFGGKPRFPLIQTPLKAFSLGRCYEGGWRSSIPPNNFQVDLYETDQSLHTLSRIMDMGHLDKEDREFFSRSIAATQHRLVSIIGDLEENNTLSNSSFIRTSNHLAASIYINLALREIALTANMNDVMVKRLKAVLEHSGSDTILTWDDNLARLLWIAFVGGAAATGRPEREFFVKILAQVRDSLLLSSLEQFRNVLECFGWLGRFCEPHSRALWREMESWSLDQLFAAHDMGHLLLDG